MLDDFAKALEMEEKMFEKAKAYLEENPGATLEELADATDIRDKIILKWLDQGRIQVGGLPSSKTNSNSDLLKQFRDVQSGMRGSSSNNEASHKRTGMHIADKKR